MLGIRSRARPLLRDEVPNYARIVARHRAEKRAVQIFSSQVNQEFNHREVGVGGGRVERTLYVHFSMAGGEAGPHALEIALPRRAQKLAVGAVEVGRMKVSE